MKIGAQLARICRIMINLLKSGKNYSILIDIKRSKVTYLKYVDNDNIKKVNLKKEGE